MKITNFTSLKGGVGKSMIVYNLSGCLADRGFKVLCIDGDPQHNLSKAMLGIKPNYGLYELLRNEVSLKDVVLSPYKDSDNKILRNIDLLPCNYNLYLYEKDSTNPNQIFEMKERLASLNGYDYILIDTNPALSFVLTSIYTYSHNYIGVFDMSKDAMDGFEFLEDSIINNIKKNVNQDLQFKGIILNHKTNRKISYNDQLVRAVKNKYNKMVFDVIISESVANKESRVVNFPMISYNSRHQSTLQYCDLTSEFIKRLDGDYNG